MHQSIRILSLFMLCIALASCAKTEKILVKQDGTWNIDRQSTTTTMDGGSPIVDTDTDAGTITFNEDGSGTITYTAGGGDSFDWVVNDDVITITLVSFGMDVDYQIDESSKNSQEWTASYSYEIFGINYEIEQELTLSRAD